jgi:hypothetical protein
MQIEVEVSDELRERLEKKAAASGMTVSDYFMRYLEQVVAVPTREEMIERLDELNRADMGSTADLERPGQLGQAISGK